MSSTVTEYVLVSNAPLRERFLQLCETDGLCASDVAARLDWTEGRKQRPDATRVLRLLGLKTQRQGPGRYQPTSRIRYEKAVALCRALNMDPIDAGV